MRNFALVFFGFMLITCPLHAATPVVSHGATAAHTVVVNSSGIIYSWGYNSDGQLGNNTHSDSRVPVEVDVSGVLSGKTITALAASTGHTLALDSDGKLYAWGANGYGQLGNSIYSASRVPTEVDMSGVLAGKTIIAIAGGYLHSMAMDSDGKLYTWGYNSNGQLGNNSTTTTDAPVEVDMSGVLSGKTIIKISAGDRHNMVMDSDGKLYTWGHNSDGQLGNNSTSDCLVPTEVDMSGVLSGKTIIAMTCGSFSSMAMDSDGNLYSWGDGGNGQLGNNTFSDSRVPVEVDMSGVLLGKTVTDIFSACASCGVMDSDGKLYTWGDNYYGQLGNKTNSDSRVPVEVDMSGVLSGKTITEIYPCRFGIKVLDSDTKMYAWGDNYHGQLGNNTTTNTNVPVKTLAADGLTDFALPITLTDFSAEGNKGFVELIWQTASETNNAGFVIYRNNTAIGSVDGAGTSSEIHNYSFTDEQVVPGSTYTYMLADVSYANEETRYPEKAVTISVTENEIPAKFVLEANYPNPFNPETVLAYELSAESNVDLSIYDMSGKKVAALVNEAQTAGNYSVSWNASDFSTGIYFYRLTAGDYVETRKMIYMK